MVRASRLIVFISILLGRQSCASIPCNLRSGSTPGLQHRPVQNSMVHHFDRVAFLVPWSRSSLDADFLVVDKDKADKLEKGLKDRYFTKDFRLRDGMDESRAYFRYETFKDIFPDRKPEFEPGRSDE